MKEVITSLQNKNIKDLIKLKKSRERKKQGLILVEGRHETSLALESGIGTKKLYLCNEFNSDENFEVNVLQENIEHVSKEVFEKISNRENPDGYLLLAKEPQNTLENAKVDENPLVIILEGVEKPGNIGAIVRSCEAAGADLIILDKPKTDIFNPNVIRASLGSIFTSQIVESDYENIQDWLKEKDIKTFAATPHTENDYLDQNYQGNCAILIGAEHEGLSEEWLKSVDHKVRINMAGKIDSLNASVSAAIVLFEVVRQRR